MVFVFGSNLAGIHGAGAALVAHEKYGAAWYVGVGRSGNSYALPTKDKDLRSLNLKGVEKHVSDFLEYAAQNPEEEFQVTQIGCGLAGFRPEEIAPLFKDAPENCFFDEVWKSWLPNKNFWGTF